MKILQPAEALTQMALGKFVVGGLDSGPDTLIAEDQGCTSFNAFVSNEAITVTCVQIGEVNDDGSEKEDTFTISAAMIGIPVYGNFSKLTPGLMVTSDGFLAYKKGVL